MSTVHDGDCTRACGCGPTLADRVQATVLQPEFYRSTDAALRAVRTTSEQSTYTAIKAENIMLHGELADLRRKLECSQLLADQAIRERDRMAPIVAAAEGLVTDAQNGMWNSSIRCEAILRSLLGLPESAPKDAIYDVLERRSC